MKTRFLLLVLLCLPLHAFATYAVPDLYIDIVPDQNPIAVGSSVNCVIHVGNNGPDFDLADNVTVSIAVHGGGGLAVTPGAGWGCGKAGAYAICQHAGMPVGAYGDIVITAGAPASGDHFDVSANISHNTTANDSDGSNNSDTEIIDLYYPVTLVAGVTASAPSVLVHQPFSYTYTLTNTGTQTATNVVLQATTCCNSAGQPIPNVLGISAGSGWSCTNYSASAMIQCLRSSLAAGATAPDITLMLEASAPGTYITGVAGIADWPSQNNQHDSTTIEVVEGADVGASITAPESTSGGALVQGSVAITNSGPSAASSVDVSLETSAGTIVDLQGSGWTCSSTHCTRNALDQASSIAFSVLTPENADSVTVTATITSSTPDPTTANNSSSVTIALGAPVSIVSLSPSSGDASGKTQVRISGEGFAPGAVAYFDNAAVPTTYVSPALLIATTNAHAAATVDVAVDNPGGGSATLAHAFTFVAGSRRRTSRH